MGTGFMNKTFYESYTTAYNKIYKQYQLLSDQDLIESWISHQHEYRCRDDFHWIAISVCEDLLRQRGNTYLDDTFPKG